jgi:TetR/AcrR family transcriptional regulator, cholesterol catabolism regulator
VQKRTSSASHGGDSTASDGNKRTPRRFDRYELIIDSSAEIFRRKGYDATGLQEIADEVGILKGSLYHYIETKEDLLFAIIQRNHERITTQNKAWREFRGDPIAAIRSFVEGHMRESLKNQTYSEVYVRDFRALSPARAKEIMKIQDAYDQEFRALIQSAVDAGLLRPGVNPAFASRAVFGMTNWIYYWYRPTGSLSAEEVVEQLADYAMASLLGPAG